MSLENNSTIAGTATVLDDWANIFSLPFSSDKTTFIPFDVVCGTCMKFLGLELAWSRLSSVQFNFISSLCGLNTKKYRG